MKYSATLSFIFLVLFSVSSHGGEVDSFKPCEDIEGFTELLNTDCATVDVPLNHNDSDNTEKIQLFVRRFAALEKRQGTVWLIAGGPGESGASFYSHIGTFRQAFPNLDILIPDHRGTGYSSTICPEESVDSVAGNTLVGEEWGSCFNHMYSNQPYVKSFSITNAAHDLDYLIKRFSGEGEVYLYGVSYGTQLSLRLLQLRSTDIDGVILDSLVPFQADNVYELSRRSSVVNDIGSEVLKRCELSPACIEKGDVRAKLTSLLVKKPLLSDYADTLPKTRLSHTLGMFLDLPDLRTRIPDIIYALDSGNTAPLLTAVNDMQNTYAAFNKGYKNYGSSIPLVQVISSSENNLRPDLNKERVAEEEKTLLFTSPLPGLLAGNAMPTYSKDAFFASVPDTLPPVVVLHGSLDPKTHLKGAVNHIAYLSPKGDINMVEIEDAPHYVALNAPTCFAEVTRQFVDDRKISANKCTEKSLVVAF